MIDFFKEKQNRPRNGALDNGSTKKNSVNNHSNTVVFLLNKKAGYRSRKIVMGYKSQNVRKDSKHFYLNDI